MEPVPDHQPDQAPPLETAETQAAGATVVPETEAPIAPDNAPAEPENVPAHGLHSTENLDNASAPEAPPAEVEQTGPSEAGAVSGQPEAAANVAPSINTSVAAALQCLPESLTAQLLNIISGAVAANPQPNLVPPAAAAAPIDAPDNAEQAPAEQDGDRDSDHTPLTLLAMAAGQQEQLPLPFPVVSSPQESRPVIGGRHGDAPMLITAGRPIRITKKCLQALMPDALHAPTVITRIQIELDGVLQNTWYTAQIKERPSQPGVRVVLNLPIRVLVGKYHCGWRLHDTEPQALVLVTMTQPTRMEGADGAGASGEPGAKKTPRGRQAAKGSGRTAPLIQRSRHILITKPVLQAYQPEALNSAVHQTRVQVEVDGELRYPIYEAKLNRHVGCAGFCVYVTGLPLSQMVGLFHRGWKQHPEQPDTLLLVASATDNTRLPPPGATTPLSPDADTTSKGQTGEEDVIVPVEGADADMTSAEEAAAAAEGTEAAAAPATDVKAGDDAAPVASTEEGKQADAGQQPKDTEAQDAEMQDAQDLPGNAAPADAQPGADIAAEEKPVGDQEMADAEAKPEAQAAAEAPAAS